MNVAAVCLVGSKKRNSHSEPAETSFVCVEEAAPGVLEDAAEADFTVLVTVTRHCYAEQPTNDSDLFTQQEKQKPVARRKTV